MYLAVKRDSNLLSIMCSWFCMAVDIVTAATVVTESVLVITRILVEVMLGKLKRIFLSYEDVQEQYSEENIWT